MNDTELDRLLDTWEAPAPPESMRQRLRARFPQAERIGFPRPLKWVLAGLCTLGLTIAIAQTGEGHGDVVMHVVDHVYTVFIFTVDSHRASLIRNEIRESQPRVYVDDRLADPLEYRGGATLVVHVPGAGVYAASMIRYVDRFSPGRGQGWVKAGRAHDNLIEFEADGHSVRIECNRPLAAGGLPVYIRRLPN